MASASPLSVAERRAALHSVLDQAPADRLTVTEWGGRSIKDIAKSGVPKPPTYTLNELVKKVEQLDKAYYASSDTYPLENHLQDRVTFADSILQLEKDSQALWIDQSDNLWLKLCWHIRHLLGRIGFNRDALLDKLSHVSSQEATNIIAQKIPDTATADRMLQSVKPPQRLRTWLNTNVIECINDDATIYLSKTEEDQVTTYTIAFYENKNSLHNESICRAVTEPKTTDQLSWSCNPNKTPITGTDFLKLLRMFNDWLADVQPPSL